ncbi:MAG: hypothetical protein LBF22_03745 [Deltaproteobacteria bacterium]|jgi:electron transport complex protein RnfC|nr:hypothetical protein [Deltaproteobacteria bacterium]
MAPHKNIFKTFPYPEFIELPLEGTRPVPGLKKGSILGQSELLAERTYPKGVDLVSPLPGRVTSITNYSITLAVDPECGAEPPAVIRLLNLGAVEALKALHRLGIPTIGPANPGEPLIISGFDPEPGLNCAPALWEDQLPTLEAGIQLLRHLFPGKPILQVLPMEIAGFPLGTTSPLHCELKYPHTLPVFLKRKILGAYDPLAGGVVSSRTLYLWGTVLRTGRAPMAFPLTLQNVAALVPPGISPEKLLLLVNLSAREDSLVVLGGLARGIPTARVQVGLSSSVEGLFLLRKKKFHTYPPEPCLHCGRCVKACPLKLPVNYLGQTPLHLWPLLLRQFPNLLQCPTCGLCALNCPSGFPLSALRQA